MKKALLKGGLYKLVAIPMIVTAIVLAFIFEDAIPQLFKLNYIFLIGLLFLIFSEYRFFRFGSIEIKPTYKTITWLLMIFGIQIAVTLLFISTVITLFSHVPVNTLNEIKAQHPLQKTLYDLFVAWGLYPWPLYALIGAALSYSYYRQKNPGLIYGTLFAVFDNDLIESLLKPACDFLVRLAHLFCISVIVGLAILQLTQGFSLFFKLQSIQFLSFRALLIPAIIYWIVISNPFQKWMIYLSRNKVALGKIVIVFSVSVIILLLGIQALIEWYLTKHPRNLIPTSIDPFQNLLWLKDWKIFVWGFWLGCTPFVASLIARISKGRSIQELAYGVMILPLTFGLIFLLYDNHILSTNIAQCLEHIMYMFKHRYVAYLILPLYSLSIILFLFYRSHDYARIDMGMLPLKDKTYLRRPGKTVINLLVGIAALVGIVMIAWVSLLGLLTLLAIVPLILPLCMSWLSLNLALCNE